MNNKKSYSFIFEQKARALSFELCHTIDTRCGILHTRGKYVPMVYFVFYLLLYIIVLVRYADSFVL